VIHSIEEAAAAGDVSVWLTAETPIEARIRALVMAADHERLDVIDELVAAGTPIDASDPLFGRQALRLAATNGRPASVRSLLAHGADPNNRDAKEHRTALNWCRLHGARAGGSQRHTEVEEILRPLTDSE
jgi:ankyrin repeat protein